MSQEFCGRAPFFAQCTAICWARCWTRWLISLKQVRHISNRLANVRSTLQFCAFFPVLSLSLSIGLHFESHLYHRSYLFHYSCVIHAIAGWKCIRSTQNHSFHSFFFVPIQHKCQYGLERFTATAIPLIFQCSARLSTYLKCESHTNDTFKSAPKLMNPYEITEKKNHVPLKMDKLKLGENYESKAMEIRILLISIIQRMDSRSIFGSTNEKCNECFFFSLGPQYRFASTNVLLSLDFVFNDPVESTKIIALHPCQRNCLPSQWHPKCNRWLAERMHQNGRKKK